MPHLTVSLTVLKARKLEDLQADISQRLISMHGTATSTQRNTQQINDWPLYK